MCAPGGASGPSTVSNRFLSACLPGCLATADAANGQMSAGALSRPAELFRITKQGCRDSDRWGGSWGRGRCYSRQTAFTVFIGTLALPLSSCASGGMNSFFGAPSVSKEKQEWCILQCLKRWNLSRANRWGSHGGRCWLPVFSLSLRTLPSHMPVTENRRPGNQEAP